MKIKSLGSNMTIVNFVNGNEILISYDTVVAGRINEKLVKTDKKWSATTARHINKYFNLEWGIDPNDPVDAKNYPIETVPQSMLDSLKLGV